MRKSIVFLTVLIALGMAAAKAAYAAQIIFGGGDGASIDAAIIVTGAANEEQGVRAERAYVAKIHPDWRESDTALLNKSGRYYDSNAYAATDGSVHILIFDVTDFFGKM